MALFIPGILAFRAGAALAEITGTGALIAQAAIVAGEGDVEGVISGVGALQAGAATVSASGTSASTGSGALASQATTVSGTGQTGAAFAVDFSEQADQCLEALPGFTQISGDPCDAEIISGELHNNSTDFVGGVYLSPDTGSADHFAEGAWRINNADCFCGVICRVADEDNYVLGHWSNGWGFRIWHIIGGVFNAIATQAGTPDIGDVIRIEVEGTNARLKVNGAVVIGNTDIDNAATNGQTRAGLASRDSEPLGPWLGTFGSGPFEDITGTGALESQAATVSGSDAVASLIESVRFEGLDYAEWSQE